MIFFQILLLLAVPILLFKLENFRSWFKPIVMAYVTGVLTGNLFPGFFDKELVQNITGISIVLAIPLMLFPTNFKKLLHQPKTIILAYGIAVVATTISVFVGFLIFKGSVPQIEIVSGMLEGVYTGGTVNLNAIAIAYDAPEDLTIVMNGLDMAFSAFYLLAIFTFLPSFLSKIMPISKIRNTGELYLGDNIFKQLNRKQKTESIIKSLGLTVFLLGSMVVISILIKGKIDDLILIFGVTAFALIMSNISVVREIRSHMILADFFMVMFGFTLGIQANVIDLLSDKSGLFGYFALTYSLMLGIHFLLSKIFKVDTHTFLISSVAAIFGPPFIGPVAESLNNRSIIAPGIIIALLGNAIGTYLGLLIIEILMGIG